MPTLADIIAEEEKKKLTLADVPDPAPAAPPKFELAPKKELVVRADVSPGPDMEAGYAEPGVMSSAMNRASQPRPLKFAYAPIGQRSIAAQTPRARDEARGVESVGQAVAPIMHGAASTGQSISDSAYGIAENLINAAKGPYPMPKEEFVKTMMGRDPNLIQTAAGDLYNQSVAEYNKTPLTSLRAGGNAVFEQKKQAWRELGPASDRVFNRLSMMGATATDLPFMLGTGLVPWMMAKGYGQGNVPGMLAGGTEALAFGVAGKLLQFVPKWWQRGALNGLGFYGLAKAQGASDDDAVDEMFMMTMMHLAGEAKPIEGAFKSVKEAGGAVMYPHMADRTNLDLLYRTAYALYDTGSKIRNSMPGMLIERELGDRFSDVMNKAAAHALGAGIKSLIPIDTKVVKGLGGWYQYLSDPKVRAELVPQLEKAKAAAQSALDESGNFKLNALKILLPKARFQELEGPQGKGLFVRKDGKLVGFTKENPDVLLMEMTPDEFMERFPGMTLEEALKKGAKKFVTGVVEYNNKLWTPVTGQDVDALIGLTGDEGVISQGHEVAHAFLRLATTPQEYAVIKKTVQELQAVQAARARMNGEYAGNEELFNPDLWQERIAETVGNILNGKMVGPYQKAIDMMKTGRFGPIQTNIDISAIRRKMMDIRDKLLSVPESGGFSERIRFVNRVIDRFTTGRAEMFAKSPNVDLAGESLRTKKNKSAEEEFPDIWGAIMASPNVSDRKTPMNMAVKQLSSDFPKRTLELLGRIDKHVGIKSSEARTSIGTYEDGAEVSMYHEYPDAIDIDSIRYAAAIRGLLMRQKSVPIFRYNPEARNAQTDKPTGLYTLRLNDKADINVVWEEAKRLGQPYLTFVKSPELTAGGAKKGYDLKVLDPGYADGANAAVHELANTLRKRGWSDGQAEYYRGDVEFLGDDSGRAKASKSFRDSIAEYERKNIRSGQVTLGQEGLGYPLGDIPSGGRYFRTKKDEFQPTKMKYYEKPNAKLKNKPIGPVRYSFPGKGKTTVLGYVTNEWKSGQVRYEEWKARTVDMDWGELENEWNKLPIRVPLPPPPEIKPGTVTDIAIKTKTGEIYFEDVNNRIMHQRRTGEILSHARLAMKLGIPWSQVASRGSIRNGEYVEYYTTSRYRTTPERKPLPQYAPGLMPGEHPVPEGMDRILPAKRYNNIQDMTYDQVHAYWDIIKKPGGMGFDVSREVLDALENAREYFSKHPQTKSAPENEITTRIIDKMMESPLVNGPIVWAKPGSLKSQGFYRQWTGRIDMEVSGRPEHLARAIVHEAMHAATMKYALRMPKQALDEWFALYKRAVKEFDTAIGLTGEGASTVANRGTVSAMEQVGVSDPGDLYGFRNMHEFLAEITNPRFRTIVGRVGNGPEVVIEAEKKANELMNKTQGVDSPIRTENLKIDKPQSGSYPITKWIDISRAADNFPIVSLDRADIEATYNLKSGSKLSDKQILQYAAKKLERTALRTKPPDGTFAQRRVNSIFEPRKTFRESIADALDSIREGGKGRLMTDFVDRWNPLLSFQRQIEKKTNSEILMKSSPYWAMIGMGGREGLIQLSYDKLRDITKGIRDIEGQFTQYLVSKRLMERESRGATNPQGITYGEADKTIRDIAEQLGPEKFARLEQSAQKFWDWADSEILVRLRDSHVISAKAYERIKNNNKNWLPFEKADIEQLEKAFNVDSRNSGETIMPDVDSAIQALHGMKEDARIKDPWESVLRRLHVITNFTEKNKALLKIVQLRAVSPWVRETVRRIKPGQELPPGTGQFGVVINGKVVKYSAPKDIIKSLQTLQPRQMRWVEEMFKKSRTVFTLGTTGLYVPFTIFNVPRDFQMALLTSRHKFNVASWMYGFMHALPSSFGWKTSLYKDYLAAQAGGSGLTERIGPAGVDVGIIGKLKEGQRSEATKQLFETKLTTNLRGLKNPAMEVSKLIKSFTGTFELATRLGVFAPARKELGPNRLFEAGMQARRSTIDFNRGGLPIKILNDILPFLNASVQAKSNMFEALFGHGDLRKGQATGPFGIKQNSARAVAWERAMLWMVIPSMAAYFYNRTYHDDEYKKLSEDYKDKFVPIMIGTGKNEFGKETVKFIPIPKDDFMKIMTRPMEKFFDWAWKKEPVKMQELAINFLSNLSPIDFEKEGKISGSRLLSGLTPPIAKSVNAFVGDRDPYWGTPYVPEQLKDADPWEQYRDKTPAPYRWMGKAAHSVLGENLPEFQSPLRLEAAARASFGNIAAAPTPGSMFEKIKQRTVREVPTTSVERAQRWDKAMDRDYTTTRIKIERELKKGLRQAGQQVVIDEAAISRAQKLMTGWNKKFFDMLKQVERELGNKPGPTWIKQYTMDSDEFAELQNKLRMEKATGRKLDVERRMGFTIK